MTAMFNLSSDDNNEAYVEIVLDIFDNSVAIRSLRSVGEGWALDGDPELYSLVKKALENRSSSQVRSSLFRDTSSHIKRVAQELKRLASRHFDRTKLAAVHALKGLKLIR